MNEDVWTDFLFYIETHARHSSYESFMTEPFFLELPPRLQSKLVEYCLGHLQEKFSLFFREMETFQLAP